MSFSQCHLYRGIHPLLYDEPEPGEDKWFEDVNQRLLAGLDKGRREGYISAGSTVILLTGWQQEDDYMNTLRIIQVANCHFSMVVSKTTDCRYFMLSTNIFISFPSLHDHISCQHL